MNKGNYMNKFFMRKEAAAFKKIYNELAKTVSPDNLYDAAMYKYSEKLGDALTKRLRKKLNNAAQEFNYGVASKDLEKRLRWAEDFELPTLPFSRDITARHYRLLNPETTKLGKLNWPDKDVYWSYFY